MNLELRLGQIFFCKIEKKINTLASPIADKSFSAL